MPRLLKRLELNGFKSFAQKTALEFPTGITAIVGPNGSGKSNVIDAIRWLLGEREARNLRSAKAEDLIFAGTQKKARLGQAQASLHFENEANFFPLEFAEISVSRQVDRDGSNKFFLNRSEVKLKDLNDFFARARLGSRGLVVISQGNSDIFVQATPSVKREMIEEMLGLREYQLKKISAERRLKNTEINLEKADALMKEIQPHLRSLKRQTGRWEKRGSLEQELIGLENEYFGKQWRELEVKIDEVEKEINSHREELKELEKEKETAADNLRKVETSQPKEREEMNRLKSELDSLLEKKSRFQKELGRIEAQIEMAKGVRDVPAPPAKLLELLKRIQKLLAGAVEGEHDLLKKTVRELLSEIEEMLSGGETEMKGLPADLKTELSILGKNLREADEEISERREKEKSLEKRREDFYGVFKKAVARVEEAKDRIEEWESRNQARLFEKERLELRFSELKRAITQAGRNPDEFRDRNSVSRETEPPAVLEKRIFKLRGDLASIGEVDEALLKEATETETRYEFLERQSADLQKARKDLESLITELSDKVRTEFSEALARINEEFGKFFRLMFGGGHAKLKILNNELRIKNNGKTAGESEGEKIVNDEEEKKAEEGVEISVSLPRKRINSLETLSGGERSLVGIAALFALISVSPPPFLVLDEVDAALDSQNSKRFAEMLKEFSKKTQFVVVTHNRAVMEAADILYGVTLNEDGASKIVSLKLE